MSDTAPTIPAETAPPTPIAGAEGNAEAPNESVPTMSKEDRQAAITEAYGEATKQLRTKYRDEAVGIQQKLLAERGIDWTPQPTKEERAKANARKVLEEAGLPIPAELA